VADAAITHRRPCRKRPSDHAAIAVRVQPYPVRLDRDDEIGGFQRSREITDQDELVRRYADNRLERLPELAAELVRLDVDVIVAIGTLAPLAAKQATTKIPIVMAGGRRPGGERARSQSGAAGRQRHGERFVGPVISRRTSGDLKPQ
jgi:hypothetical protein